MAEGETCPSDENEWEEEEEQTVKGNPAWTDEVLTKLQERNAHERDCFQSIAHAYSALTEQNQHLKQKVVQLERQLSLFETWVNLRCIQRNFETS
jgi:predicted RNase H-like nuclease (RuvC/YqgF family)